MIFLLSTFLDFEFRSRSFFSFIIEWGGRGDAEETLCMNAKKRAQKPEKRARSLGMTVGSEKWTSGPVQKSISGRSFTSAARSARIEKFQFLPFP